MVIVNRAKCLGCGTCVFFCPVDAMEGFRTIEINRDKCIDCLDCVEACPVDALEAKK